MYICLQSTEMLVLFFLISWGGVRLSPGSASATILPIIPAADDIW
jgi:hypothetical protein